MILGIIGYAAARIWPSFEKLLFDIFAVLWGIAVANINISLWLFLPILFLALVPLFQILAARRKCTPTERTWRDYRKGTYFGIAWKWDYEFNGRIVNVTAYCPRCGLQLVYDQYRTGTHQPQTNFICDDCGKIATIEGSNIEAWDKVIRKIERDITTDEWERQIRSGEAERVGPIN